MRLSQRSSKLPKLQEADVPTAEFSLSRAGRYVHQREQKLG